MSVRDIIQAAAGGAVEQTDPYFENTVLLLHGDGTNGGQNNTFIDSSSNNFTITRNGNTTQGSFSPYGNLWSNYFDGTGGYLTSPANAAFDFGTGDWTVECWFYIAGNSSTNANGTRDGSLYSLNNSSASSAFNLTISGNASTTGTGIQLFKSTNTTVDIKKTVTVAQGVWHHIAVTKASGTIRMFLNGVQQGTSDSDSTLWGSSTHASVVGRQGWPTFVHQFNGYISNLRVVKGTALYTTNFTPPTAPLTAVSGTSLLTCQSNRFVDNSSNNFTLTVNGNTSVQRFSPFNPTAPYSTATIGGSAYVRGSPDYLTLAGGMPSGQGTAFTLEGFFYVTDLSSYHEITGGTADGSIEIAISAGGQIRADNTGVVNIVNSGSSVIKANEWFHLALTRSTGNIYRIWLNGVNVGTSSAYTVSMSQNTTLFRHRTNTTEYFRGYASNFRVVASEVYTSNFTPPTAPLTAITNTSLLLNFANAAIFDNTQKNDLETVGNAQISTSVKKYGTGSIAFDGTGDWLLAPRNWNIGSGENFTVEGWIYLTAAQANYRMILSDYNSTTPSASQYIAVTAAGVEVQVGGAAGTIASCSYSFAQNTWYHLAAVRNSNTVSIYVNGTGQTVSQPSQSGAFIHQGNILYVGRWGGTTAYEWVGYIDDLRITKGIARYTGNFTPPNKAFPNT